MSSFKCEHCNADIIDTPQPRGYITECPHYPLRRIIGRKAQKQFVKNRKREARRSNDRRDR